MVLYRRRTIETLLRGHALPTSAVQYTLHYSLADQLCPRFLSTMQEWLIHYQPLGAHYQIGALTTVVVQRLQLGDRL